MKKFYLLTKTLLVAALLMVGANAWADGAKRVLNSQDYESVGATDWTCTNGNATLVTGDPTYGKYAQCTPSGSGNRAISKSVTFSSDPSGYTTSGLTTAGYNIEFDFVLVGGNVVARSSSIFRINTSGDPIFTLSQPSLAAEGPNAGIGEGKNGTAVTTWYINDLTNATEETVTLDGSTWYHLKLVVTATSAAYTITNNSTSALVKSGSKTIASITKITGFGGQVGRGSGKLNFDNLDIYEYVDAEIVTVPTISDPVYAGANRTVTVIAGVSSKSNAVTTYYTVNGSAPSALNYEGKFTTASEDVTITSSCTVKAISISETSVESSVSSRSVTAGKLTLNAPTFEKTSYSAGKYDVAIYSSQSSLEFPPASATIKYSIDGGDAETYSGEPVSVTAGSTLTAYVESANYTNSSDANCVAGVRVNYPEAWSQDYTQITKGDGTANYQIVLSGEKDFTVGTRDFKNIIGYINGTTKSTSLDTHVGLNTASYFYLRCNGGNSGILKNSASGGTAGYIGLQNLTIGQIVLVKVNSYVNTYRGGMTAEIGLDYLENISTSTEKFFEVTATGASIYFPDGAYSYVQGIYTYNRTVSVTIGTSGFATFSSDYALNFDDTDVTPYCASAAAGGEVTMTKLTGDIAANTGLFLKGDNGADTYVIPVVATAGSVPATNYLKPTTGENIYNGSKFQYVYANQSAGYAFYKVGSTLAPAKGKAYLETAASAAGARMTIMFDDEVTGIENLTPALSEGKGAFYDLQGRRVAQPTKGLYIVNGRKVVVK